MATYLGSTCCAVGCRCLTVRLVVLDLLECRAFCLLLLLFEALGLELLDEEHLEGLAAQGTQLRVDLVGHIDRHELEEATCLVGDRVSLARRNRQGA